MKKYFMYIRSAKTSKQGYSYLYQEEILKEYASKNKLKIVGKYIDNSSIRTKNRPVFEKMLIDIKKDKADGILCLRLDRLCRDLATGSKLLELVCLGKIIITPEMNYDASLIAIEIGISNMDNMIRRERVRKGVLAAKS